MLPAFRIRFPILCITLILTIAVSLTASENGDNKLEQAKQLFQQGEYEKALSLYESMVTDKQLAWSANLGLARVLQEKGEYAKAEQSCQKALASFPDNPDALNLLGEILKQTGRYQEAREHFEKAVHANPNHLHSRLNLGIMQWEWGEKDAARRTLQNFISYYQTHPKLTAEETYLIARACVYLGRFRDANSLFADATKLDEKLWQAYIPWGNLMLSKYNVPDAHGIFEDALKVNSNASEAHLGLAKCVSDTSFEDAISRTEKALVINPNLVTAHDFLGELQIAIGEFDAALDKLQKSLETNPNSLTTRSLRAVCFYFLKENDKFENEVAKILAVNPKYGALYYQIAEILQRRYLFKESIEYYQKALALDPEHWSAHAGLGTSLSRIGKEEAAKAELEIAFARDPYNKHVGNLLRLFDEYDQYKIHQTKHFLIRIHEKDDAVLAPYAIKLAEESFSSLQEKYQLRNQQPVVLEIFPEHDDFAVRCFGLPGAEAFLGICFGNVVAMDSPRARTTGDFDWGETLWHELVHVSHLRLTENRIPRWLAEGIAVYETSVARPYWSMNLDIPFILAFENNRTLPLKDLDSGFNRPTSPGQVTLSYFQASLVVEFIVERYGFEKLLATFPEFKRGSQTPEVVRDVFGKNIDDFDEEFRNYVTEKYRLKEVDFAYDQQEVRSNAHDLENYLTEKLSENSSNPFLNFQLGMYYKEKKQYDDAIPYLEKAKQLFPQYVGKENPYKALAEIYVEKGEKNSAIAELTDLTSRDGKDLETLRLLADLCIQTKGYDSAIDALNKAIYISPYESDTHTRLAQAYLHKKEYDAAITEFQVTLQTHPQDMAGAHCDLAEAWLKAGKKGEAKKAALAALEIAPNYERAQEILLASLE